MTPRYTLHHGDALAIMPVLEENSVDCIIADPPYGTTACKWDSVIPFEPMWACIKHVLKPKGACVLFGSQPFTSALVMSNVQWFKYEWVWKKSRASGFLHAKNAPLKSHENMVVFSLSPVAHETKNENRMFYHPQMSKGEPYRKFNRTEIKHRWGGIGRPSNTDYLLVNNGERYPTSVVDFSHHNFGLVHPTQKPVPLLEYLIKTYTNEGDTVLDFTMGSGTTGVGCARTNRKFIGIELDPTYFEVAQARIMNAYGDFVPTPKEKARPQLSLLERIQS